MSKVFNTLIIFSFLILFSQSDLSDYKCDYLNNLSELKVGDEVILCIHIVELKKKVALQIKVDEYSVVSIDGLYNFYSQQIRNTKEREESNMRLLAQIKDVTSVFTSVRNNYIFT